MNEVELRQKQLADYKEALTDLLTSYEQLEAENAQFKKIYKVAVSIVQATDEPTLTTNWATDRLKLALLGIEKIE